MEKKDRTCQSFAEDMPQHVPMSLADRAKIFQPFEPLKGFADALREQEQIAEFEALVGDGVHRVSDDPMRSEDLIEVQPIWDEKLGWLS
ncbi:hypothetical protein [Atopobium fossor]|uniref:hypothetical protein n=1 Tax=Atopobium fossor TaxID=39487 RepID=UPI0012EB1BD1|nr:hypothetical protein [Atopobium fossor]